MCDNLRDLHNDQTITVKLIILLEEHSLKGSACKNTVHKVASALASSAFYIVADIKLSIMHNLADTAELKVMTPYFRSELRSNSTRDGTLAHNRCLQLSAWHHILLGKLLI